MWGNEAMTNPSNSLTKYLYYHETLAEYSGAFSMKTFREYQWGVNAISPEHDCGGPPDCLWCVADIEFEKKSSPLIKKGFEFTLLSTEPLKETGNIRVQFGKGDKRKCILVKIRK